MIACVTARNNFHVGCGGEVYESATIRLTQTMTPRSPRDLAGEPNNKWRWALASLSLWMKRCQRTE